jgi:hypothetical protein
VVVVMDFRFLFLEPVVEALSTLEGAAMKVSFQVLPSSPSVAHDVKKSILRTAIDGFVF